MEAGNGQLKKTTLFRYPRSIDRANYLWQSAFYTDNSGSNPPAEEFNIILFWLYFK